MKQTQNYKLCQWSAADRILRSDFNQDNSKIDKALADETAARKSADSIEAIERQSADEQEVSDRKNAILAEAAARRNADDDEAQARKAADNAEIAARQKAINDEIAARKAAVSAETTARQTAVTNLQNSFNTHSTAINHLGNCEVYLSMYTGNGQDSRSWTFPHRPMIVFLHATIGPQSLCAVRGTEQCASLGEVGDWYTGLSWSGNTFTWGRHARDTTSYGPNYHCNASGTNYMLIALLDMTM